MIDKEKVIKEFEHLLNAAKGNYQDFVDLTVDLGEDILVLLKEQEVKPIIHCKDCKYGSYTGTEYLCDKNSGHENRFGEDQYYKEWHNGNWFCADGESGEVG